MRFLLRLREWIAKAIARPQEAELQAAYLRLCRVTDSFLDSNSQAEKVTEDEAV
jgi:hypothetical protein